MLSLLSLLWRASRPSWDVLGRVSDKAEDVFVSLEAHPHAKTMPGLLIFRFNQQLFFANATGFRDDIRRALRDADRPVQVVLVDAQVIADVDITGLTMLDELQKELAGMGIELWFTRVRDDVMDYIRNFGLEESIGPEHFYLSVRTGVEAYLIRHKTMDAQQ
jgi:SulP family sulfate permease